MGDLTNESQPGPFSEGDIFFAEQENAFFLFKILRLDETLGTAHVIIYGGFPEIPSLDQLVYEKIQVFHAPVAMDGLDPSKLLGNMPVRDEELSGYFHYIKETGNGRELVFFAKSLYQAAYHLTDLRQFEEAIRKYSLAIDLIPQFYEAIDNRAFCKMDMERWEEAMEDFRQSLRVNPDNTAAEFSIGECYLHLGETENARGQFLKVLTLNPVHEKARAYLNKYFET